MWNLLDNLGQARYSTCCSGPRVFASGERMPEWIVPEGLELQRKTLTQLVRRKSFAVTEIDLIQPGVNP
jgi:hypothetical protein